MRIADAVEEDEAVAVRSEVVRVLMSPVAGVIEGVVKLESGFVGSLSGYPLSRIPTSL